MTVIILGKIVQHWCRCFYSINILSMAMFQNALLINNPVSPAGALTFEVPQDGTEIDVRINVTNTGPSTLDWMGIQTVPIIHPDGLPLILKKKCKGVALINLLNLAVIGFY